MRIEDISEYLLQPMTEKSELNIGDEIIVIHDPEKRYESTRIGAIRAGYTGTVCDLSDIWAYYGVGICFDEDIGQHDCHGTCEYGHGYYLHPRDFRLLYDNDEEIIADETAFGLFLGRL